MLLVACGGSNNSGSTVSDMTGTGLVLFDNGSDELAIGGDGPFHLHLRHAPSCRGGGITAPHDKCHDTARPIGRFLTQRLQRRWRTEVTVAVQRNGDIPTAFASADSVSDMTTTGLVLQDNVVAFGGYQPPHLLHVDGRHNAAGRKKVVGRAGIEPATT